MEKTNKYAYDLQFIPVSPLDETPQGKERWTLSLLTIKLYGIMSNWQPINRSHINSFGTIETTIETSMSVFKFLIHETISQIWGYDDKDRKITVLNTIGYNSSKGKEARVNANSRKRERGDGKEDGCGGSSWTYDDGDCDGWGSAVAEDVLTRMDAGEAGGRTTAGPARGEGWMGDRRRRQRWARGKLRRRRTTEGVKMARRRRARRGSGAWRPDAGGSSGQRLLRTERMATATARKRRERVRLSNDDKERRRRARAVELGL
uniref:Uncharacterized protein n=1 Tax=Oryza punctata TaxID=4537 RepID=A0A0E0KZH5_ORYPU